MQVAINGCGHGDLDMIYETIADAERKSGDKVDLLLCCGDFQVRHRVLRVGSSVLSMRMQ